MIIKVICLDGRKVPYVIQDEKNLRGIIVTVISGDHTIIPLYEDGHFDPMFDPTRNARSLNFYYGTFFIETIHIADYNNLVASDNIFHVSWAEQLNKVID